jgi:predicted amidohydrolase YtcJ
MIRSRPPRRPWSARLPSALGLAAALALAHAATLGATGVATSPTLGDIQSQIAAPPNGRIYVARRILTMDPQRSSAAAVAVIGGRILAVGSLDDLKHATGEQPFMLDETFKDKVLVPGFIDPLVHPMLAALALSGEVIAVEDWNLPDGLRPGVRTPEDYRARLRDAHGRLADPKTLLLTWGWQPELHGPLTRADLDAVSTTRPILVWHRSGRELVANTTALERWQVTPDYLSRQSPGAQSQSDLAAGRFWDHGLAGVLPQLGPALAATERLDKGLALVEGYLHAGGVTTVVEMGSPGTRPLQPAQNAVLGDDATPFRTYYVPDGKALAEAHPGDPQGMIAATRALAGPAAGRTAVLPNQVALFADGSIFRATMQVEGGYDDGHQGLWLMEPERFSAVFDAYWDAGFQIHVQADGDAGVELVLDALERAMRREPRFDHRTTVMSLGLANDMQIKRLARLGAIVGANPYTVTALADAYARAGLGAPRADNLVPLGAVRRAGVPVTLHSALPLAPAQPLSLMAAAVNRTTLSNRVAAPDQRLSIEDALAAVTINAAYALRLNAHIGSIEPGKLANFTVLNGDPLASPAEQLGAIGVWGTVLEGRVQPVSRPALPARTAGLGLPGPMVAGDAGHDLARGLLRGGGASGR